MGDTLSTGILKRGGGVNGWHNKMFMSFLTNVFVKEKSTEDLNVAL